VSDKVQAVFAPDSRTLAISESDAFSFWDVATHALIRRIEREVTEFPGWVAFSADGKLLALELAAGNMHLIESSSGKTIARLEDPHGDRAAWQSFTPDRGRLVVVSRGANITHVWDLRAIRSRLKAMNLDWDWPELPPPGNGDWQSLKITAATNGSQ
jgi:WD40 repeat protein